MRDEGVMRIAGHEVSMTGWIPVAAVIGGACVALLVHGRRTEEPTRESARPLPDVVIISVDTLRRDHLSLYGYGRETDPSLVRLATDALVFDNAVAAHTNTGPSHASMMTGRYPPSHGVLRNRYHLRAGVSTLAEVLRRRGYQTAAVVSSVMLSDRLTGLGRGFDAYLECAAGVSDRQAEETWAVLERLLPSLDSGRPLFLFVHFFDPHYPYRAPEPYSRAFLPPGKPGFRFPENAELARLRAGGALDGELDEYVARYDGEILYADHHVGLVLERLRTLGRYEDALLVVLSDHGETLAERPFVFDHGARAYDEQIRIPLIVHLPRAKCGGLRTSVPAHHVDLVPTVLEVLGLPVPGTIEGVSLLRELEVDPGARSADADGCSARTYRGGQRDPRGTHETRRPLVSFARPDARRVSHIVEPVVDRGLVASLRLWPWKLISYPVVDGRYEALFSLVEDRGELHNVANEHPERVRAMAETLQPWVRAVEGATTARPAPISGEDTELLKSLGYLR